MLRPPTRRLGRADLLQVGAALAIATSLLLPWYATEGANPNATVAGTRGEVSAWVAHPVLRWVLLAAAAAVLASVALTLAGHGPEAGVHRGERTAVLALSMAMLLVFQGWLYRPGEPSGTIQIEYGWFLALVGVLATLTAALTRLPPPARTPPGGR